MGNKSTSPQHGQPNRAYPSGTESNGSVAEASGGGAGSSDSEQDFIDIQLIQVNATVQAITKVGDRVLLKQFEAHVHSKRLGDIPHSYREVVEKGYSKNGNVVNIEIPTIRLFGK
jgi:hypothetical protein